MRMTILKLLRDGTSVQGITHTKADMLKNNYSIISFTLLRFCTKTERKTSVFCESVHTDLHKNAKKRRFSKTLPKVDIHKNGGI